jgi:DNA-binding transcriptional regulator YiaG
MKFTSYISSIGISKFARLLGVTRQRVNNWHKKANRPGITMMMKIVKFSKGKLNLDSFR